ncbi:hypothetical protein CR492_16135 [Methylocella silvestris]|uniref:Sel1 domain protein repeat-containing protein n=2 Tax=Methylocella silvestris TaxID=199596 RepID=A0A2J7TDU2_METSI|nr:hypothetical protein CR492_16135 [Methylocella silvestris]
MEAQAWLGSFYANGTGGVAPSLPKALAWYIRAAGQGHVQAATNVGAMLAMGQGARQDRAEGAKWLAQAAERGDPMAQYNLATLLSKGDGVPVDNKRAADLYRRAAETGHFPSQARLGYFYANGLGVEKNRIAAFAWLSLAARHGIGIALTALESLVADMSGEEKKRGLGLAQKFQSQMASGTAPPTINPIPG